MGCLCPTISQTKKYQQDQIPHGISNEDAESEVTEKAKAQAKSKVNTRMDSRHNGTVSPARACAWGLCVGRGFAHTGALCVQGSCVCRGLACAGGFARFARTGASHGQGLCAHKGFVRARALRAQGFCVRKGFARGGGFARTEALRAQELCVRRGFARVGALHAQGLCTRRGFARTGALRVQGLCARRGLVRTGALHAQGLRPRLAVRAQRPVAEHPAHLPTVLRAAAPFVTAALPALSPMPHAVSTHCGHCYDI